MALTSYGSVEEAVKGCFGTGTSVAGKVRFGAGDINSTYKLTLSSGDHVLIKTNSAKNADFFDAEEAGLAAIAATGTIATPHLYAKGVDRQNGISFLMMDLIETGRAGNDAMERMGRQFADMHLADAASFSGGGRYGFLRDDYIGASVQANTPKDNWIDFFRECRLEVQFKMASHAFSGENIRDMQSVLDRLDDLLTEPSKPSLLHGDMWGGNHLIDKDGRPVLIDPAAYVGHPEADIAMTQMFSPVPQAFYAGYYEKIPKEYGYEDRRDLYNLYHVLNHYNLFGGGYLASAVRIISRYAHSV
ncbi:MAG: fructosamine kinase family protein [Lachnospiraceae bacterium]|nr:fructosamine kinase family protein [Lachnospiraceae bacterium]